MIIYRRNIYKQLLIFRLLFIVTTLTCFYLFKKGLTDYGILVTVVLLGLSIISISAITIKQDFIKFHQYYFWGFILLTTTFKKGDKIEISLLEIEFSDPGSPITSNDWDNVLFSGSFKKTVVSKNYIIKMIDSSGNIKKIKTNLSSKEYYLITEYIEGVHSITKAL